MGTGVFATWQPSILGYGEEDGAELLGSASARSSVWTGKWQHLWNRCICLQESCFQTLTSTFLGSYLESQSSSVWLMVIRSSDRQCGFNCIWLIEKTGNHLGLSAPEADPEIRIQGQTFILGGGGDSRKHWLEVRKLRLEGEGHP